MNNELDVLYGTICLSLAIGFEEDRARLGLSAAVERLRDALVYNGLLMDGDEHLFADVLEGSVSSIEICGGDPLDERGGFGRAAGSPLNVNLLLRFHDPQSE